jgi:biotin carboxyl carrier protein
VKIKVRVDNQDYDVEVGDLDVNPIVAIVEGERFEVWAEDVSTPTALAAASSAVPAVSAPAAEAPARAHAPVPVWKPRQTDVIPGQENALVAPIPGLIAEVFVKEGDTVVYGQTLVTLEAMKMLNPLRASRAGTVKKVYVAVGQVVKSREALVEIG